MAPPFICRCPMLRLILVYGVFSGILAILPMAWVVLGGGHTTGAQSYLVGYLILLVALTAVFLGIKQCRDRLLGGAIGFGTAFLVGLGISTVAGCIYVLGWEISLALTGNDFAQNYARSLVAAARAKGASPARLAEVQAQAASFVRIYAQPLARMGMTFLEIFPVGVLVSLISAGLLRHRQLLPAAGQ